MNNREYLHFIKSLETLFPMQDLSLWGIDVWPLIKCLYFKKLVKAELPTKRSSRLLVLCVSFKRRILHTINSLFDQKNIFFPHKADILFIGNNLTKAKLNGEYYDYLMQPIMENAKAQGKASIFIERGEYTKFPRSKCSFQFRFYEELSAALGFMILPFVFFYCLFRKDLRQAYIALKTSLLLQGCPCRIWDLLLFFSQIFVLSRFYSILLVLVKPKSIYISCYYTRSGLAISHAAYRRGIPLTDVQHGNVFNNFAYLGWTSKNGENYNTLPSDFWFWSDFNVCLFNDHNSADFLINHHASNEGLPWANFWKQNTPEIKQYLEPIKNRSSGYSRIVLVTLRESLNNSDEWSSLVEIIKNSTESVFWFIRNHPTLAGIGRTPKYLQAILSLDQINVDYQIACSSPLFALFQCVDLHVTTASFAAEEATAFGLPTIFISELALQEMPYLIDGKMNKILTNRNILSGSIISEI